MAIQTMEKNSVFKYFETLKSKFFKIVILNSIFFTAITIIIISIMGLSSFVHDVLKTQNNVFDILVCLPVILLGPITSAIIKVLRDFVRGEPGFFAEDLKKAFKDNFRQSIVIALLQYIFVWAIYIASVFYWNMSGTLGTIGLGVTIFVAVAFVFASYYFYMMTVTLKITVREIIKNSFIFTMLCFLKNILLTIILAIWLGFIAWFTFMVIASHNAFLYGLAIILYMTLVFGIAFYTIAYFTFPSVKKYVLDPYYEEHPEESSKGIGQKSTNDDGKVNEDLPEFVYHNGKMVARSALENEKVFSDENIEE